MFDGCVHRPAIAGVLFLSGVLGALPSAAQDIVLDVPAEALVGASMAIGWSGPEGERDFVSVDEEGAPDSSYGSYIYTARGNPGRLRAPEVPGRYLIRYHSGGSGYPVRASSPLTVIDTTASFEPLGAVDAGSSVTITWTGPAHERDYISIDEPGAGDRSYGTYAYTTKNPVTLRVPDEPGEYVVRYHLGESYRVIGQTPLTVGGVEATLEAAPTAQAGGTIEVHWTGPDGESDYISIDPPNAAPQSYLEYAYTKRGSPATIRVPEETGSYEIRYHMARSRNVLATLPLEVLGNTATVSGPASAAGGSRFEVGWTGPANPGDFLTIVAAGADNRDYNDYAHTSEGSPASLEAPLEVGPHELRYVTGRRRQVLASVPIEVTPGKIPGTLRVTGSDSSSAAGAADRFGAVEVILDASGSMLQRLGGEHRIEVAKSSVERLLGDVLPAGAPFALRVFGHREADSCRTDLEIPLAPLDTAAALSKVRGITAMNRAKTPIGASLLAVKDDLATVEGPATVILVTDGEETCDGDPPAAIEELKRAGFDVRVNIVGFAIDDLALKETFEAWARAGGGRYVEADDGKQLAEAMTTSLERGFEVLDGDRVVASGLVNGKAVELAAGSYSVRLSGANEALGEVTIEPRQEHQLRLD
jgi:hypothetical protein